MKLIVLMPVRNEEWILEKSLKIASLFADTIIVGDQNSTDRTFDICKRSSKVIYLVNSDEYPGTRNRRQILLNKARQLYGAGNIIFCLDADEIPTANILNNQEWRNLLRELEPGQSIFLQMLNLWRSPLKYRDDNSCWSNSRKPFLFKDDGRTNYALGNVHESKAPQRFEERAVRFEPVKILHFQFVLWGRMLSKQAHCRIMEKQKLGRSDFKINARYWITKDERNISLTEVSADWLTPYLEKRIDLKNFPESDLYWFDIEILHDFKKYGTKLFKWLDIWDIDWEKKRQKASERGFKNLPDNKIEDPRSFFIGFYHQYLQFLFSYSSFFYKLYQFLRKIW